MKIHKRKIIKAKPGYNPFQPLCDDDFWAVQMAKDWKNVTCKKCHLIRAGKDKRRSRNERIMAVC